MRGRQTPSKDLRRADTYPDPIVRAFRRRRGVRGGSGAIPTLPWPAGFLLLSLLPVLAGRFEPAADAESPAGAIEASATAPPGESPQPLDSPESSGGLWPSKRLLRSLLTRRVADICHENGFDESQCGKTREAIVDEWSEFLTERRERLQPLLNELVEMRLDVEPPNRERVQDWAEKAAPMFEELRDRATRSVDKLREIVKPEQKAAFEAQAVKVRAGLALAQARLLRWRAGEIDPNDLWEPLPGVPRGPRSDPNSPTDDANAEDGRRNAVDLSEPTLGAVALDQIEMELISWDRFLDAFIEEHKLDAAQRDAARSCLSEMKERALAHRDRHREEIADLERRIAAHPGGADAVDAIRRDIVRLYGPIDEMFAELRRRIEPIATMEQREAAEKLRPAASPGPTPTP